MNWIESYPYIAHRGLHGTGVVENSERAIERAIEKGYAVEVDVQFLSDGEPIIFHDDSLKRLIGDSSKVRNLNPKFLTYLRYSDGQGILLLRELLELVNARTPLLIEIKNETYTKSGLNNLIKYLLLYRGKFSLQSFNPQILKSIKQKAPHFSIGQLTTLWQNTHVNFWQQKYLQFAELYNDLDFISVDKNKLGLKEIMICRYKKIPLLSWTIKSSKELERVSEQASGFIFESFLP